MSGIYVHIPFCRQACHYCDFHFSTNLSRQQEMIDAIAKEITVRADYLNEPIRTIYFGGGTPSLLTESQLEVLLSTINQVFEVEDDAEVALEANPEDLTNEKLSFFKKLGVNRLSIGLQTFSEQGLSWINRAHTPKESEEAFHRARASGFSNISLDLIYALPNFQVWEDDLKKIVKLSPEHVSLYGLTVEEKTVFGNWKAKQKLQELPEDQAAEQYLRAISMLTENGYQHYEVSNFCKPGHESRHNSSYWIGDHYLGVGPGAHSYDGRSRHWNIRNNAIYLRELAGDSLPYETEHLSDTQKVNEHILTRLRTSKGIDLALFRQSFGHDLFQLHEKMIQTLAQQDFLTLENDHLKLSRTGLLIADDIALKLFFEE